MPANLADLRIIDADTHVVKPAAQFTSRVSTHGWGDLVPHVKLSPTTGMETWFYGDTELFGASHYAHAGWKEWFPAGPPRMVDVDPILSDPAKRLTRMDEYGIHAQVLYPNVGIFAASKYLGADSDPQLMLDCSRAYNDWLSEEWVGPAPDRYLAMMTLPIWNLRSALKEMIRCK